VQHIGFTTLILLTCLLNAPAALSLREEPPVRIVQKVAVGWTTTGLEAQAKSRNVYPPPQESNSDCPSVQSAAVTHLTGNCVAMLMITSGECLE
jgi:hypothetical protein